MGLAMEQARLALRRDEVPVGALLLHPDGRYWADGNRTRELGQPGAHGEKLVMEAACSKLGDWRLSGCTLYTTLEPCLMCAGMAVLARVGRIVYGAWDKRFGALGSVTDLMSMPGLNHYPDVLGGLMARESSQLLREFFRSHRG
jgi:tRNA(adenine34) deaminase